MKKTIFKIILACLILIFLIFIFLKSRKVNSFEDILFLKIFQNTTNSQENSDNYDYYEFNVNSKNKRLEVIDLYSTTNDNSLVKEKIAPGTNGEFSIGLIANKFSRYKVNFVSKNEKPRNLKFKAYENEKNIGEANSLEELSNNLSGKLNKNELKIIKIKWSWEYESESKEDTEDSKIEKYEFGIYVEGEEI